MENLRYTPENVKKKSGQLKRRATNWVSQHLGESKAARAGRVIIGEINAQEKEKK